MQYGGPHKCELRLEKRLMVLVFMRGDSTQHILHTKSMRDSTEKDCESYNIMFIKLLCPNEFHMSFRTVDWLLHTPIGAVIHVTYFVSLGVEPTTLVLKAYHSYQHSGIS